jgi:hypothetical protein
MLSGAFIAALCTAGLSACRTADAELPRVPDGGTLTEAWITEVDDSRVAEAAEGMVVLDSQVVVFDGKAQVHLFDLVHGRHVSTLPVSASDIAVLAGAEQMERDPVDRDRFWIYGSSSAQAVAFRISGKTDRLLTEERVRFPASPLVLQPVWINGDNILATGLFEDGRFALFGRDGRREGAVGEIPRDPQARSVPAPIRQHAFIGSLTASPARGRFAIATRHADEISFFSADGRQIRHVRGSTGFDPRYTVRRVKGIPYMTTGDDLRFGYIHLASSDSAVYALFSGRVRGAQEGFANYGRYIQVFDWDGNLMRTVALGSPAIKLAVSRKDHVLLALSQRPGRLVRVHLGAE